MFYTYVICDIYSSQGEWDSTPIGLHSQSQGWLRSGSEAVVCELLVCPQDEANAIKEIMTLHRTLVHLKKHM